MIRLTQTFGAHAGRVIELEREVVRFGRLPDNEMAFDPHADLDCSGRHAELRREAGQWVIVDVGSRNGTLVAGKRVMRHVLASGEEVEFGLGGPRVRIELVQKPSQATAAATPLGAGVETAAATPIAIKSSPPPPNETHPPPLRPTPPPSPFQGQALSPAPLPQGMGPAAQPPVGLPQMPAVAMPMAGAPIPSPMGAPMPGPKPAMAPAGAMPGAPMPAGEPKRFGQRTVGLMIQAALEQAEQHRSQGGNRSTAFLRAVASEAAQRSSRGLKIAVVLLTLLVFVTIGAVVALFFYARWQEQGLRDENVRLQRQLAELDDTDSSERQRLESRIQALNEQLSTRQDAMGVRIAEENEGAVYLLLTERSGGRREVECTAFAVQPNLLATNAHCVGALERAMSRGQVVRALANRGAGGPVVVRRMWRHPMYVPDVPAPTPDVGLLRIDGTARQQVRLASMADLSRVRVGDDVFVYGFPGDIPNTNAPVAVLTSGVIGRMTRFDGSDTDFSTRHLVSHSAFATGSLSGSPLFDRDGRVVGLNAGNYRGETRVIDTGTRMGRTVNAETSYAWAVRVDLLLQLIAGLPPG